MMVGFGEADELQELRKQVRILAEQIKDLTEENELLESRRGGECSQCGSWVCPPLTCTSCMSGEDRESILRTTNSTLTQKVLEQAEQIDQLKLAVCPLKGQLREARETALWTIEKQKMQRTIDQQAEQLADKDEMIGEMVAANPDMCWRACWACGKDQIHRASVTPGVLCRFCKSQDTRLMREETEDLQALKGGE
jgi:hypothetical protein